MAQKSYPPQHTDNTLKIFGIESFADLYSVVLADNEAKLRVGRWYWNRQSFWKSHFDQCLCTTQTTNPPFPIPEALDFYVVYPTVLDLRESAPFPLLDVLFPKPAFFGFIDVRHMTSCSVFQEIMAGLDLTYKMRFTDRLHFSEASRADCAFQVSEYQLG